MKKKSGSISKSTMLSVPIMTLETNGMKPHWYLTNTWKKYEI